jgi:hypothetical protein
MEPRRDADEGNLTSLTRGPDKELPPSNTDWAADEAEVTEEVDTRASADPETPPREPDAAKRRSRHVRIVWLQRLPPAARPDCHLHLKPA